MDFVTALCVSMGSAWLSGINLYATVATLGLLERFGMAHLPGDLHVLGTWWVIGLAGALYLVEFFADKIPWLDTAWDAVHTFIRVPAGAVLAASAFADFDPAVRTVALLVGGGVALSSHGSKAAVRLAANTSPEPFTNIALSLFEDTVAIGLSLLMAFHPLVVLGIVLVFVAIAIWLIPRILRALKRMLWRIGSLLGLSDGSVRLN